MISLFSCQINCVKQPSDFPDRDRISLLDIEQIIDESPIIDYDSFNPQKLIRAVNTLRNFSKDEVLLISQNYSNKHNSLYGDMRIDVILQVLFVPNEKETMFPELFPFGFRDRKERPLFPIFPLTLEEDIPFSLYGKYIYTGGRENISERFERLEYFKNYFKIREKPLNPPLNPFVVADNFLKSERGKNLIKYDWSLSLMLRYQTANMVQSVYPPPYYYDNISWQKHIKNFSKLNVIWDPVNNDYKIKK